MDVHLTQDQQERLSRIAADRGCTEESIVTEAVERLLLHEEWFIRKVDEGIAAAAQGELVDHDDVRRMIESRNPE